MQIKQPTHWASLLTLLMIGASLTFLLLIVTALVISSLMELLSSEGDPASSMISAAAFGFVALLLLASGWFVLQKTRGTEQADLPFRFPYAIWQWAVILPVTGFAILFGGVMTLLELPWLNWLLLPTLTLLVIAPPIWLLFGSASQGLELGPRWRFFAVFSLSITLAPAVMIVLEMIVLMGIIVTGVVYAAITQPDLITELERMAGLINENMSEEALLTLLTPYITNPLLIGTGIGYIAVIVPLIEELLKPLAVWLFARKIESPAQGFALGVLSGAAFALFESLNASADGTVGWAMIVTARTGTSVLHMLTSGLVGWGIAAAFQQRRFGRFISAYMAAFLIHGIWNAAAAGIGLSALGQSVGKPEWLFNFAPALLCGLLVMGIGVTALLFASNRALRAETQRLEKEKVESAA